MVVPAAQAPSSGDYTQTQKNENGYKKVVINKDNHDKPILAAKPKSPQGKSGGWFSDWIQDKDKVCTDGKDDGHLSLGEGLASFGKGIIGCFKEVVKNPTKALTIAAFTTAIPIAVIGAAAIVGVPILTAASAVMGVVGGVSAIAGGITLGKGLYDAANAKTDAEAKRKLEKAGNGGFLLFGGLTGIKSPSNPGLLTNPVLTILSDLGFQSIGIQPILHS